MTLYENHPKIWYIEKQLKSGFPLVEGRSCGACDQLPYPA